MVNQNQNIGRMNDLNAWSATSDKLGSFGRFTFKTTPTVIGQAGVVKWWEFIHAVYCVNLAGVTLLPGQRVVFGSTYGIYKSIVRVASAGERGDGVVPWNITNGVPANSTFYVIQSGPCKVRFDGVDVAIANGDRLGPGAAGGAQKLGGSNQTADGTVITGDAAADAVSLSLAANTLVVGVPQRFKAAGVAPATNSTDTLTNLIKVAGQTVGSTGAIDLANDDAFFVDITITPRSIGATGSLEVNGFVSMKSTTIPIQKTITVDTTAAVPVAVNSDWSSASAGNQFKITNASLGPVAGGAGGFLPCFGRALEAVASDAADATLFEAMVDFTPFN